jgi:hypothetical protein
MQLHDLTDFLRLSATLHLQLSAQGVGWQNILQIILPLTGFLKPWP